MNISEMLKYHDKQVTVQFERLRIPCRVVDVKESYGKLRLLVKPLNGDGQAWIEESRIINVIPE